MAWLTARQAARAFGISESTARRRVKSGEYRSRVAESGLLLIEVPDFYRRAENDTAPLASQPLLATQKLPWGLVLLIILGGFVLMWGIIPQLITTRNAAPSATLTPTVPIRPLEPIVLTEQGGKEAELRRYFFELSTVFAGLDNAYTQMISLQDGALTRDNAWRAKTQLITDYLIQAAQRVQSIGVPPDEAGGVHVATVRAAIAAQRLATEFNLYAQSGVLSHVIVANRYAETYREEISAANAQLVAFKRRYGF